MFFLSLQLPIHKSVVVSLRDSDDSDSDVDNCSSSQMSFGGLEFMIKEARRTAEVGVVDGRSGVFQKAQTGRFQNRKDTQTLQSGAVSSNSASSLFTTKSLSCVFQAAKPKAASASEKENNPVRTPEALPEDKKLEYRLLREQIAR